MQKRTFKRIFEQHKTVIQIVSVEVTWDDENPALPEPNPSLPSLIIEGKIRAAEALADQDPAEGYPADGYPADGCRPDPGAPDVDLSEGRDDPGGRPED